MPEAGREKEERDDYPRGEQTYTTDPDLDSACQPDHVTAETPER